ncbi:MAG TPA: class I SAM-dependent rRNA methyltransferase, partial [Bacteroidales bacterium]|nr:class I SAM-dependent rRNA methyltransferase [Bacteroidales bacterium]
MERIKIVLKSGKDQSPRRFHPWIFSGAIKKIYGNPSEGDLVDVYDNKDEFLAVGHYQPGSIAVRIISFKNVNSDTDFFRTRIKSAIEYRKSIGLAHNDHTNVYRLIHAEGDDMPGLIIDYYNGVAVMQMHSVGMYRLRKDFAEILKELLGDQLKAVFDKSEGTIPVMSG